MKLFKVNPAFFPCTVHGQPSSKGMILEGSVGTVLAPAVAEHLINILAIALPRGILAVPSSLIPALRSCQGATLIFPQAVVEVAVPMAAVPGEAEGGTQVKKVDRSSAPTRS